MEASLRLGSIDHTRKKKRGQLEPWYLQEKAKAFGWECNVERLKECEYTLLR